MAQPTDNSDDRRRRPKDDSGYEVLPDDDDEDEPHDAEYRRRRWGNVEETRPKGRRPGKFPFIVNVLGVACAIAVLATASLAVLGVVFVVVAIANRHSPGKFVVGMLGWFAVMTHFYGKIAWGVWQRRVDSEVLFRCSLGSLAVGGLVGCIWFSCLIQSLGGKDGSTRQIISGVVLAVALLMIVIGILSLATREILKQWREERRRRRDES